MGWLNTTADNSVPEDIGQNLHRHTVHVVWAAAESCWNQPPSLFPSVNSGKNCWIMTFSYILQLFHYYKTLFQQSFLHLQHTRHQHSPGESEHHELDQDSVSFGSNYFAYLWNSASETTLPHKRMSISDKSHLWRQTVETKCKNEPGSHSWKACMDSCFMGSKLQQLCWASCTRLLTLQSLELEDVSVIF
jgi:hypothetical protein